MGFEAIIWEHQPALKARVDAPERIETLLTRLHAGVVEGRFTLPQAEEVLARVAEVAEPADTLLYLLQFSELEGGAQRLAGPEALRVFILLAGQGEHPAHLLLRHPEDLLYLSEEHHTQQRNYGGRGLDSLLEELNQRIEAAVAGGGAIEEVAFAELRRLKRRESLRIYLREIEHASSVRQTAAEIANLAQACLEVACVQGARLLGRPELVEHFCVLGMGKLGGTELNFSSDVDLIYICSNWVCTDETALEDDLKSKIDHLARWVTRALSEGTDDGYVFRVDLRLRPDGNKGGLVNSVGAMVAYYLNWGSTWERSALIKARAVGGNHALAEFLFESLEPFMFRRYLDFKVIDALRSMKEQIDRNAHVSAIVGLKEQEVLPQLEPTRPTSALQTRLRRKLGRAGTLRRSRAGKVLAKKLRTEPASAAKGLPKPPKQSRPAGVQDEGADTRRDARDASPFGWDVKIGVGGIREIEFFVQALQLIHCGTRESLRVRGTLDALDRLLYVGLITHQDHGALADAYDLFRRVEHRIQMESDRQYHRLPPDIEGFSRLARRMMLDEDELRESLTFCREKVSVIFERLFRDSAKTSREPTVRESRPGELLTVMGVSPEHLFDPVARDALLTLGFRHPRQAAGQLQVLREQNYGPFSLRAGTEQSQLGRYLLQACASAPDPDQALNNWARLAAMIGERPSFYGMLFENPHATRLLVHLLGSSEFLASIILREPNVIEYLLGAPTVAVVREREEMAQELERRLAGIDDPSHRLGRVRRFHQEEVLRIALHEVAGACEIDVSVRQLSMLAEVLIDAVLGEVYANLSESLAGEAPALEQLGFVVLAMGKLGGREISLGSDLDIVFIYEATDDEVGLDPSFYRRLAQRLVRNLSSVSAQGKMYKVDTRLRPSGSQGTLVVSLEGFREYHAKYADLWERQAMIRARALTGSGSLRRKVMALRREIVFQSANPPDLAEGMFEMRRRISREFGSAGTSFDIKFDAGGMVDVEFLTQYLQLYYGYRWAEADGAKEVGAALQILEQQTSGERVVLGPRSQNTMRALAGLAEAAERNDIELGVDCVQLLEDYRMLRRVEARLRISDLRASNQLPADPDELTVLARRLGFQGAGAGEQFRAELDVLAERVSQAFQMVLGQP